MTKYHYRDQDSMTAEVHHKLSSCHCISRGQWYKTVPTIRV